MNRHVIENGDVLLFLDVYYYYCLLCHSLCWCSFSAGLKACTCSVIHSSHHSGSYTKHLPEDSCRSQHADLLDLCHSSSFWYFLDVFYHYYYYYCYCYNYYYYFFIILIKHSFWMFCWSLPWTTSHRPWPYVSKILRRILALPSKHAVCNDSKRMWHQSLLTTFLCLSRQFIMYQIMTGTTVTLRNFQIRLVVLNVLYLCLSLGFEMDKQHQ